MKLSTYSMLNVSANLDGVSVKCFFDGDDAVSVAPASDVGSMIIGADGCGVFSQMADRSAEITLRLQHTSPTHKRLMRKLEQQRAGRVLPFPFDVIDTVSNEGGSTDEALISRAPTDSKGKNATVREWVLVCVNWKNEIPVG